MLRTSMEPVLSVVERPIDRVAIALSLVAALAGAAPEAARTGVAGHFNVPSVRPSPAASASADAVGNGGFESGNVDGGWFQCADVPAYVTREHPHSGEYDEYSGTLTGAGEPVGNSGVCQWIAVPPGGMLTAYLYQLSNEPNTSFAYQEADLLDDRGNVVVNLYKTANYKPVWVRGTWNLGAYAGHTYWLYFGVHGDGYVKLATQQFVDDVTLTGSASPKGE
jgi:hypothetical protein